MRILFISDLWKPFPGGAESYAFNVAREMKARGHKIGVLTSYEKAVPADPDFDFFYDPKIGQWTTLSKEYRSELAAIYLKEFKPDLIFIH
jgi:hypothetical protein